MAEVVGSIEEILRSAKEMCFQWRIGDFLSLSPSRTFYSPCISWRDASWHMEVWQCRERLRLVLFREYGGPALTLKVSVGLRGPIGVQHQREWEREFREDYGWSLWRGDSSPHLADVRRNLLQPDRSLVVWCQMKARDPCPQFASEATNEGIASSEKRGTMGGLLGSQAQRNPAASLFNSGTPNSNTIYNSPASSNMTFSHSNSGLGFSGTNSNQLGYLSGLELGPALPQSTKGYASSSMGPIGASLITVGTNAGATKEVLESPRKKDQQSSASCVVCFENPVDSVLYRCGHMCMCYGCAFQIITSNPKCPICRASIVDVTRVYR